MNAEPANEGQSDSYEGKEAVIRALLQREAQGASLRTRTVKAEDRPLYVAAIRHFRIWGDLLRVAGIDPESVSGRRRWTAARVRQRIRELHQDGIDLNLKSIRKIDGGLVQAARKYYACWDNALTAAGFDASAIRIQRPNWTRREILQAIQAHAATGAGVHRFAMRPTSVCVAAERLFGSYEAALKAAGVLHLRNKPVGWSHKGVIDAIRSRQRSGEPLNCVAVIKRYPPLYDAARRYYGGWNEALTAAGIDPNDVRAIRRPWTREDVICELRRRVAAGVRPTRVSSIRPTSLVFACRRFFGSCEAAALAAKIDPARIGYFRCPKNGLHRTTKKERTQ